MAKSFHFISLIVLLNFALAEISYNHVRMRSYCCYCNSWHLPCPFCTFLTPNACSLTDDALTGWATEVIRVFGTFNPPSQPYLSYDSIKSTQDTHWLHPDTSLLGFTNYGWKYPCEAIPRQFDNYYGSFSNLVCDKFTDDSCDNYDSCSEAITVPVTNKQAKYKNFCAYQKLSQPGWYFLDAGAPNNLCNRDSRTSTICPELLLFLQAEALPPLLDLTSTQDNENIYIHTQNRQRASYLFPYLTATVQINPYYPITKAYHSMCTNSTAVIEKFGDLNWGYWLNLAIIIRPTPCEKYVPYNTTHDVCVHDIFAPFGTPACQDTFKRITFDPRSTTLTFPIPINNLSSTVACTDCVDYLIQNWPHKSAADYEAFANLQGRLASERQAVTFSWWENIIGGVLTAPLFSKFRDALFEVVDYLLIEFLKIVGDILINLLNTVYSLLKSSQPFIDMLVEYITKILDTLFSLLALILKIAFGLLLQAEQHFLIFEYTCLFLFLNYKFLNNNIFCLIIVIVFAIIFGVERHSPSILLTLYSPQYDYVDFSYYNSKYFSYIYNITIHNRKNQSSVSFPIGLPSFSQIPQYNTTIIASNNSFTYFPVIFNNVTCDRFPYYNTTSNHTTNYFNKLIHN